MSNLVIVAIPDENDRVWKVSSDKVPHLTILFLGDADTVQNLDSIVGFVMHAADTMLNRFYLPVDRRGQLGEDQADVLFFKKGRYDYKAIRDFRTALLQDNNIKKAYDNSTQFDGPWQPHLTLGYPAAPAKSIPDEFSTFYDVNFNKIAVWTEDFDGPELLLKDYWDEADTMAVAPMDIAMSAVRHASDSVSDTPWSNFKASDYTDEQWARACLLDRGSDVEGKQRYKLPVREPDGKLNRNGCHAAAAVLSSKGGSGSARGNKMQATPEQLAVAKKKLVSLYKGPLGEDVPEGLGGEKKSEMAQTVDLGVEFLAHYGVKGMRWGVRNERGGTNTSGVGETKREGIQRFLDPQGHQLSSDITKVAIGSLVPIVAPLTVPANIRITRGAFRGAKAKALNRQEQKFIKNAQSTKNFVAIHNGSGPRFNRDIVGINQKYSETDLAKPAKKKQYDAEVQKLLQDAYRESANSLVNKANTMHLDVEFRNNGDDFVIKARPGAGTPIGQSLPTPNDRTRVESVRHAAEDDDTVTFTGKIKRDAAGYIVGFDFDDFEQKSMAQSMDLGSVLVSSLLENADLAHYGVKGMHWGVRRERAVTTQTHIDTGLRRRRTKVQAKGGVALPAHDDAVKAAVAKQVVKKSGTDALSTQELRDLANRLQVENQVSVLMSSKGKQFVAKQLETESKEALKRGAKKGARAAAPHVIRRASRGAATVATTAALL